MKQSQKPVPVVVRLPRQLVTTLDKAADENCRSRSAEVKARLQASVNRGRR